MKLLDILRKLGLIRENGIFYIGGSDVLPPPLKGSEELLTLQALEQGDEDARQRLVEHNLRLVVYIARRFENTGVNLEDLDLHRNHWFNQGHQHLQAGQEDQAGDLRLPVH